MDPFPGKEQCNEQLTAILESTLNDILSPFSKKLSDPLVNLTPKEIQIADLIKLGQTNKEIAKVLTVSAHTIATHRENIRKKLGLKHKKINLKSYLSSLAQSPVFSLFLTVDSILHCPLK